MDELTIMTKPLYAKNFYCFHKLVEIFPIVTTTLGMIDTLYNCGVIVGSIIDFILAIIALILGYALTVKFENDPNK